MVKTQQPLENITRFEADRLVDKRIFLDKVTAVVVGLTAVSAGTFAYLWNKYVAAQKVLTDGVQNFLPQSPDLDYDKVLVSSLALAAAYITYHTGKLIHSAVTTRRMYDSNPATFVRERYNKELVLTNK